MLRQPHPCPSPCPPCSCTVVSVHQVVYILDQIRALELELNQRLEDAGLQVEVGCRGGGGRWGVREGQSISDGKGVVGYLLQ